MERLATAAAWTVVVVVCACCASCADPTCPTPASAFELDSTPASSGAAEIEAFTVDEGLLTIELTMDEGRSTWTISVPSGVSVATPPSSAFLLAEDTDCFGEGCDPSYFRLLDREGGVVFIEGGDTQELDGLLSGGAEVDGVVDLAETDACLSLFHIDGGDLLLGADETQQVTIDDARFVAVGLGGADRHNYTTPFCADCSPGFHHTRSASGYVLRLE